MENVLISYNIILTILLTIVVTGFYVVYMRNRERGFLFLSLFYFLMIIDNSVVYLSEFSQSFEALYETNDILYIVIYLIYFGIIMTSRLIISDLFNDKFSTMEKRFTIIVPLVILVLFIYTPFQIGEFVVHFSFFTALSYIAYRAYKNIDHNTDKFDEKILKKYRIFMFSILILSVIGIVDNAIYFLEYYNDQNLTSVTLEYRTIAFDIIKLLVCIVGIVILHNILKSLFAMKDMGEKSKSKKLEDFCIEYSLTTRQREIIELIIEGYSNKEIGSKLNITEGTVKTHIYNIFKKIDISSRNQLLKKIMYN